MLIDICGTCNLIVVYVFARLSNLIKSNSSAACIHIEMCYAISLYLLDARFIKVYINFYIQKFQCFI